MSYRDSPAEKSSYRFSVEEDEQDTFLPAQRSIPNKGAGRPVKIFLASLSAFIGLCILITLGKRHGAQVIQPLTSSYLTKIASAILPHTSTQVPPHGLTLTNFTAVDPSKTLILQVDNRDLSSYLASGENATDFSIVPFYANSVLANILYAQRHGYKYERLEAVVEEDVPFRHITWWKMPSIRRALEKYELVLFLDSDAFLYNQDYSLHDLAIRWGMHDGIAMCASTDYWVNWHINTGVMLFKRSDMAFEILDTLIACPEDPNSGCAAWRDKPFHEQTALNNQLRPAHPEWAEYIALAPCNETLGGPQAHCKGTIIRHEAGYTDDGRSYKEKVSEDVGSIFAQTMLQLLRARISSAGIQEGTSLTV